MDKRLLSPGFLSNNLEYVQKELAKEGKSVTVVPDTNEVYRTGITYEVHEIEGGD
jgi:hypothetical protein